MNSGRATREHSIEETAHKTNLEAADEIGRQLRLRDLAGLIVIDFIDMEDGRNDRNVEKRIRDATKNDRARIQIGKISQFGLLEMSRQRLRAGVIAGSTVPCPHCGGQGIVRSVESTALRVLRGLEEEGQKQRAAAVIVRVPDDVAIYTLNQKRRELARIESDYGMIITFVAKNEVLAGNFEIERTAVRAPEDRKFFPTEAPPPEETLAEAPSDLSEEVEEEEEHEDMTHAEPPAQGHERAPRAEQEPRAENGEGEGGRRRRRRRRRGRDRDRAPGTGTGTGTGTETSRPQQPQQARQEPQQRVESFVEDRFGFNDDIPDTTPIDDMEPVAAEPGAPRADGQFENRGGQSADGAQGEGQRRRRRRRGRRRGGERLGVDPAANIEGVPVDGSVRDVGEEITGTADDGVEADAAITKIDVAPVVPNLPSAPVWSLTPETPRQPAPAAKPEPVAAQAPAAPEPAASEPPQPARKGWWQRALKG